MIYMLVNIGSDMPPVVVAMQAFQWEASGYWWPMRQKTQNL